MSFWIILSWVFVAVLTAINVAVFLKLKGASEQMLKMAFPNAKNMNEALAGMQQMMGQMGGRMGSAGSRGPGAPFGGPGMRTGGKPGAGAGGGDAQLKAAMQMLQQMQQKGKR